jgi:hypothetical protein
MSRLHLLGQSIWPSARRALASAFSVFTWPLFLIALVSFAKLMAWAGILDLSGALRGVVEQQDSVINDLVALLKGSLGLTLPPGVIDILLVYVFVGSAIQHSERDEILAMRLDADERRRVLGEALRECRPEYLFYRVPPLLRGLAIRLFWPLVAVYRLMTPYVVEGPGPSGDEISTSVPARDLPEFAEMVVAGGDWSAQTLYDHRQVIVWQFLLGAGGAWLANVAAGLF